MEMVGLLILIAGLVMGQPPEIYKKPHITSMSIHTDIKYRFATTKVTSRVKNPGNTLREALFDVTLPNEAFITNLTLEIDGKIVLGEVKEKEVAKAQYEAAKSRGESAGYIGTIERATNFFTLSVSVAAEGKVTFNLTYQELLKRTHGYYEEMIYINPGQPVPEFDVTVTILESREITQLTVPSQSNLIDGDLLGSSIAVISQTSPTTAIIKYTPTLEQQTTERDMGLTGKFVVRYDVDRAMDAGEVMVVNGYFVHFFAPEGFQPIPNDVLFILDKSGSMADRKMVQLKEAMITILQDMQEGDRINIMTFSSKGNLWKDHMIDISDEDVRAETERFIQSIRPSGMTNIEDALSKGLEFMAELPVEDEPRSRTIVFLTDGEATSGDTSSDGILNKVKKMNVEADIPIFTLAFGDGADYSLVKKLAAQNNGFGRKIYEASDASMQIAGFYSEIAVTLLSNITFNYLDVKEVTNTHFSNYFNGSELIICGIYEGQFDMWDNETENDNVTAKSINLRVESLGRSGPSVLVIADNIDIETPAGLENLTKAGDFEEITEKVWAYLTIKQLLEKELASDNQTEKEALEKKVLDLSLKYGFVTPLTSMVVTLPNVTRPDMDLGREQESLEYDYSFQYQDGVFKPMHLLPPPVQGKAFMSQLLPPKRNQKKSRPVLTAHRMDIAASMMDAIDVSDDPTNLPQYTSFKVPINGGLMHFSEPIPDDMQRDPLPGLAQKGRVVKKKKKAKNMKDRKDKRRVVKKKKKGKNTKSRKDKRKRSQLMPLSITTPYTRDPFCFKLPTMSPFGATTYQILVAKDFEIHAAVSSNSDGMTGIRVYRNGTLLETFSGNKRTKNTIINTPESVNCSISVKSRDGPLRIEANCGSDVMANGGIIDTFMSRNMEVSPRGKKKMFVKVHDKMGGSKNYLARKHKSRGQKCFKFSPKNILKVADFLL